MVGLRRRTMITAESGIDPNTPYTTGLGLHLDAIDNTGGSGHDSTYYNWRDIVSGIEFVQSPSPYKEFNSNNFKFDNSHYFKANNQTKKSWGTLEIVINGYSGTQVVFQTAGSGQALGIASTKNNAVLFGAGGTKSVAYQDGIHTYTCDGTNVYVDGIKKSSAGVTASWSQDGWVIGTWNPLSYKYTGYVYAVRGYDRVLTEEEIAFNASIDKARFR